MKNKTTLIKVILLILGGTILLESDAQINEWSKQPALEVYYTPLKFDRYNFANGGPSEKYLENSLSISLTTPITEKLRAGAQFISIANRVLRAPVDRAFLLSTFAQYNFLPQEKIGFYLEGGYAIGNLCTCGNQEAFSTDSLYHFIQMGVGANFRVTNRFHVKLGIINYSPIIGPKDIYNWTQPFIGLKYHFFKKYRTPFKSRFKEKPPRPAKERLGLFWKDERVRRWNIGFSSAGVIFTQHKLFDGQTGPLYRYREFVITPRVNYWINQAIMVGVQGSYYYYEDNYNNISQKNGLGAGLQARFYPLSFGDPTAYRALRIGRRSNWNIAPVVGVELQVANYSWLEPEFAGDDWAYFNFKPYVGFALSYKKWFNLFWGAGPTVGVGGFEKISTFNLNVVGFEYHFSR